MAAGIAKKKLQSLISIVAPRKMKNIYKEET